MKHLILTFLLTLLLTSVQALSLTPNQKNQIQVCVEQYKNDLIKLCHEKRDNNDKLKSHFLDLFASINQPHIRDYGDLDKGGALTESISTYLRKINQRYDQGMDVRFIKSEIIDKVETIGGKFGVYSLEKSTTYKGDINLYQEIILVNLPDNEKDNNAYKISAVLSATDFKYNHNYSCAALINICPEDKERIQIQKEADTLYLKDPSNPQPIDSYMYLAKRYPDDQYAKKKLTEYKNTQAPDVFLMQAKRYLAQKEFAKAINWYTCHLELYPNDAEYKAVSDTVNALRKTHTDLIYNIDIQKAEDATAKKYFGNAHFYYNDALQFKPNDPTALKRLKDVIKKDDEYANKMIDTAVRLYNTDKTNNAGVYFKILYDNEGDGSRISTTQYLIMAGLLYNNPPSLRQVMGFKGNDLDDYKKKYYKKLKERAAIETNAELKDTIVFFFKNIINKPLN
ncbi:MAG: hypothetical protein V4592_04325 [Bacteroidota bacterium]